jgi:ABC-2 type transport system permease protein
MSLLLHIIFFKTKMFWKVTTTRSIQSVIKNGASFVVFSSFAVGGFFFARFTTAYLLQHVQVGLFLFHRFIAMALFVFFLAINLGNMVVSFSTMFRSPEVHFLLTSPVSHLNIFIIKFLDNFFYSSGTLFLAGLSVLLGYGSYFGLPWYFYLFAMFGVLVPFMLLAGCLAVIVLLLLLKLAEKISVKGLLAALMIFYFIQIILYFTVTSPVHLVEEVMKYYPNVNLYFGHLDPPLTKMLPNYWAAEILYFIVDGKLGIAVGFWLVLFCASTASFIFMVVVGNSLYYSGWLTSLTLRFFSFKLKSVKKSLFSFEQRSHFEPQTEVLLKKEFWQFFREPSQWIHFSIMMVLVIVFLSSIGALDVTLQRPQWRAAIYLVLLTFNIFLMTSIALRFAFPMMSLEGTAYWTLRSSPLRVQSVYWTKFLILLLPLIVVSLCTAVISGIPFRGFPMLMRLSVVIMVLAMICLASLNFGLGAYFSNYTEKNPIRIASSQGATLTFLLSLTYLVFIISIFFVPLEVFFRALYFNGQFHSAVITIAAAVLVSLTVIVAFAAHAMGVRSLRRDF